MKLKSHVAYHFLYNKDFLVEMVNKLYTEPWKDDQYYRAEKFFEFLTSVDSKKYYVTQTVIDNLNRFDFERDNETGNYDWSIFYELSSQKKTFILPDNFILQIRVDEEIIEFFFLKGYPIADGNFNVDFDAFYLDRSTYRLKEEFKQGSKVDIEQYVFKLLVFIFLTDNDEVLLAKGRKTEGTKKSGKIINDLNDDVTIVNSRWNTTVVRDEEFWVVNKRPVLRWTGVGRTKPRMVFIAPYKKQGYRRNAPKSV